MQSSPASARPSMFVRAVTDNAGLKLLALGLSVLLFSLVHSDIDAQRSVYVDVVTLLPPPGAGKMLLSELPTQVRVTLRGSRSKLSDLSRDDFSPVQIDLRDAKPGKHYIESGAIDVGGTAQVVEVAPSALDLVWADAAEKRVPVQVQLEGALERGTSLNGDVEVEPSYVTLRGPAERLASLSTVSTDPVSLVGFGLGSHTRRVPLEPLPQHVTYGDDSSVEIRLVVVQEVAERTFPGIEVAIVGGAVATLRPTQVAVTVRGPADLVQGLEPESIVPFVESGHEAGTLPQEVKLRDVTEGVEVVRIVPPSVLVRQESK